jgi:hypothetical protein
LTAKSLCLDFLNTQLFEIKRFYFDKFSILDFLQGNQLNDCQNRGFRIEDAKFHPDCKKLPKTLLKLLGQQWVDSDVEEKQLAGKLFLPCLSSKDVDRIIDSIDLLKNNRSRLEESVTYWKDVRCLKDTEKITSPGEIFFYSEAGYHLVPVTL